MLFGLPEDLKEQADNKRKAENHELRKVSLSSGFKLGRYNQYILLIIERLCSHDESEEGTYKSYFQEVIVLVMTDDLGPP